MPPSIDSTQRSSTERTAAEMVRLAGALLGALDAQQRAKLCVPPEDEAELRTYHYTPMERRGLPLLEMDPTQEQLALEFVASGLSRSGYNTVSILLGIENVLSEQDGWTHRPYPFREAPGRFRDPRLYYLAIFGDPAGAAPWAWRFEGHHIALHYAVHDGAVASASPAFLGAHPAETTLSVGNVLRPLADVEDAGRELARSLDTAQRASGIIAAAAPPDIVMSNRPAVQEGATPFTLSALMRESESGPRRERWERFLHELGYTKEHDQAASYSATPKGIASTSLTEPQRGLMRELLSRYVERMPEEIARVEAAKFDGAAMDAIHFAWAGSLEPGEPHYYRLQGPGLLVEYDNTQNGVNHVHSVWRDPEGDFGADLLAQHYAQAH